MNEIKCPKELQFDNNVPSIFLGGGITDCPDWQQDVCNALKSYDVDLVNPRRHEFDITNPNMSSGQIKWEYEHLSRCNYIIFWFPSETLCPITLYELGFYASKGKKLFVGCHPEYKRRFDVIEQLKCANSDIKVNDNFDDLLTDVKHYLDILKYSRINWIGR